VGETEKVIFCGVFSCEQSDCEYHIRNGDGFDMPNNFNNLKYTEVCKLDRDCENCKNRVDGECQKWECKYEPKEKTNAV